MNRKEEKIKKRMRNLAGLMVMVCALLAPTLSLRASEPVNIDSTNTFSSEAKQETKVTVLNDSISNELQKEMITEFEIDHTKPEIDISSQLKSRGTSTMGEDPVGVLPGELTTADNMEMHFFSTTQNALLFLGLTSENANYYTQLYIVDFSTGNAAPANVSVSAGNATAINGVPQGDYMFVVASADGSVGQSYEMMVNAQNPAGDIRKIEYLGPTLENAMIVYTDGNLYANGKYAFNYDNPDVSNLGWSRVFQLNYPEGGYHARTHEISDVKIKEIKLEPISYDSNYAKSTFAIQIYLAPGTLFKYCDTNYGNGGPFSIDFIDTIGQQTPRRLDEGDTTLYNCILIYSLNEMKPIDLYGGLNWYYYHKIESAVRTFY